MNFQNHQENVPLNSVILHFDVSQNTTLLIDIRTISGNTDSWYDLMPRTNKSMVCGAVRLKISLQMAHENPNEQIAPFAIQYTCIHKTVVRVKS